MAIRAESQTRPVVHNSTQILLYTNLLFIGFLLLVLYFGDKLVYNRPDGLLNPYWSLTDPMVHGLVGVIVVLPFVRFARSGLSKIGYLFAGGGLAVLIDLDHVIAAGSINLYDITHIPGSRPFSHGLLFVVIVAGVVGLVSRRGKWGWFVFAVLASHVIRDASGGGVNYFLWPVVDISKITPLMYYGLILILLLGSMVIAQLFQQSKPRKKHQVQSQPAFVGMD